MVGVVDANCTLFLYWGVADTRGMKLLRGVVS
jgi:hypothetical protein